MATYAGRYFGQNWRLSFRPGVTDRSHCAYSNYQVVYITAHPLPSVEFHLLALAWK